MKTPQAWLTPSDQAPPLSEQLDQLGQAVRFDPPAAFAQQAKITDPAVYRAAADGPAWWAAQARQRLHWDVPFTSVLAHHLGR